MLVIFLKDLPGQAKKGEIKDVSHGHANNFLIPKGFAERATPAVLAKVEKEVKEAKAKQERHNEKLIALKKALENRTFILKVKIGDKGQIFGGVHEKDIAEAVNRIMDTSFEKKQIVLPGVLKTIGEHDARLKISPGIEATLKIKIETL